MVDFLLDEIRGPLIVTSRGTKKQSIVRVIITEENIPEEKLKEIAGKFPVVVFGPGKKVEIFAFREDRNFGFAFYDSDLYLQNEEDEQNFVLDFNALTLMLEIRSDHPWNFKIFGIDSEMKIRIFHDQPKISSDNLLDSVLENTFARKIK